MGAGEEEREEEEIHLLKEVDMKLHNITYMGSEIFIFTTHLGYVHTALVLNSDELLRSDIFCLDVHII